MFKLSQHSTDRAITVYFHLRSVLKINMKSDSKNQNMGAMNKDYMKNKGAKIKHQTEKAV
jgi:hypothetical protein